MIAFYLTLGILTTIVTLFLLGFGIYVCINGNPGIFVVLLVVSLLTGCMAGAYYYSAMKAKNESLPENRVEILKQNIVNAQREYEKFLIDHPEFKEEE